MWQEWNKLLAGNHPNAFTIDNGPNLSEGFFYYFIDIETFLNLHNLNNKKSTLDSFCYSLIKWNCKPNMMQQIPKEWKALEAFDT